MLDSFYGYKIPSEQEIKNALYKAVKDINETSGFSNAVQSADFKNYIFTISFEFTDVNKVKTVLHKAIVKHNEKFKTNIATPTIYYDTNKKVFKRDFDYSDIIKKSFDTLKEEDKGLFGDASIVSIYHFDRDISKVSNTYAKISPNKKAAFLKVDAISLMQGKKSLSNTIQLN